MVARLDGARRRLEAEQDGRAWMAWHVAALTRAAKLPDLKTLLVRSETKKQQSPQEQSISMDQLFLAWGGDPAQLAIAREGRE